MEDWEIVLHEIYRNDPELSEQRSSKKIDAKKLAKQLDFKDKELAMKLSFLKEQGLINEKNKKLEVTKKGTCYYAQNTVLKEVKRGIFLFTSSLILATSLNFINWLKITNPWILLAILFLGVSIINFMSLNFIE